MIQTQPEIVSALKERIEAVAQWIADQPDDRFEFAPPEKWTAGQHLEHLIRSTEPVRTAMQMPKPALKENFGTPDRPSRTFEETVAQYQAALAAGGAASGAFVPPAISLSKKQALVEQYREEATRIADTVADWSEEELDEHFLPHPLLGNMTMREMLFFTTYHNQHHLETLKKHY